MQADYLRLDGALAYVEQAGDGQPVLCLHTAGQSGVQYRNSIEALARLGYRVIVPDLPGHGRSEPLSSGPVSDLGRYAEWCQALIQVLDLHHPFVVGCSIGGKISLDLGTRMADRLAGVVAMAADARNTRVSIGGLRRELEDVAAPSRSDRTYLGTLATIGPSVPPDRAELIAQMHRREDPVVSNSDLIGWGTHDLRGLLPKIGCPAHLVVGADDLWLDPADARWAADQIPGARFTVLDGIGHYPMQEIDDFADVLHGWLRDLTDDAAHRNTAA
ncbi:MAG TPA: alpha/beta hydrolase [Actinomadura sp.]|jgi:pimeloyl-ACP methyl ester carboxylesterase|nr:alpha/beta hydrolase [Actinomadura sp.]